MRTTLAARTSLAIASSGALWFLSTGPNNLWLLAWLAPVPLLLVLLDLRLVPATIAAFVASALGALNWSVAYGFSIPLVLMVAVPFTVAVCVWRVVAKRAGPVVSVLAYAALIASTEFLFSRISPHGTLGSVSYSQGDVPVVLQIASVTGLWGISFVVSLVAAATVTAWRHRRERRAAAFSIYAGAVPVVLAVIFGVVRLGAAPKGGEVRVGLAVSDVEAASQFAGGHSGEVLRSLRAYADRVAALADQGATLAVLPEKFVRVTSENSEQATAILSEAARKNKVMIVAGWLLETSAGRRNLALVFDVDGQVVLEYDKHHLIPGIELDYLRGNTIGLLGGTPATGVAICKDLDFPALGRAYAQAGVGLLLVPAWDFGDDRWVHSRMAILRGVEGGYAIVRSATEGLLTVSDAYGRVLAERASDESSEVLLSTVVDFGAGGTFYSRNGDWFGWLSIGVVLAACTAAALGSPPNERLQPTAASAMVSRRG